MFMLKKLNGWEGIAQVRTFAKRQGEYAVRAHKHIIKQIIKHKKASHVGGFILER